MAFGAVCSLCFAYPILLPTDVNTILCWCLCLPFSIGIFAGCGHGLWVLGEEARAERERGSLEGPRIGDVVFYVTPQERTWGHRVPHVFACGKHYRQTGRQTEREISGVERLQLELRGGNEEGGHECGQCGVSFVYGELGGSFGVKTTDRVFKKNSWFSSSNLQANM